jgi:predicted amidohydrolase
MGIQDRRAPGLNKLHVKSLQQLMELVRPKRVHLLKGIAVHMISRAVQHLKKEEGPHLSLVAIASRLLAVRVSISVMLEMSKRQL